LKLLDRSLVVRPIGERLGLVERGANGSLRVSHQRA
jgi:hypothetical protein